MMIQQRAGDVEIRLYTDGHPVNGTLRIYRNTGTEYQTHQEHAIRVEGLRDLRYCADRALAMLNEAQTR